MSNVPLKIFIVACAATTLAACGGGSVNSGPPPIVSPPPPPPPPTPPADPEGPIGLVSNEPFAVLGVASDYAADADGNISVGPQERADIALQYRGSDGSYVLTLPGYRPGVLQTVGYNGSFKGDRWLTVYGTSNFLLDGESRRQDAFVTLSWPKGPLSPPESLSYTGWGNWVDDGQFEGTSTSGNFGYFAYGIPTAKQDVPVTGTATYDARIIGSGNENYDPTGVWVDTIDGTAQLRFDFGAGTLAGEMNPTVCPWDCYYAGKYTFVDTVYATGSQVFSGRFSFNGKEVPSWFEGSFNGPRAAELMARFQAPYTVYIDNQPHSGTMGGIWIGKKN